MSDQPLITRWSDVDSWLQAEARQCTRLHVLPASVAFAFHHGRLSVVVETPPFCIEDADLITDELVRFLPQLHADQLLVMSPGAYEPDEADAGTLWVLRAHIGERGKPWRTVLHLLPFEDPHMAVEPVEIEPPDPWSARIRRLFDLHVPPIHESALITPMDHRFAVYFHSHGPFAGATSLSGFN